MRKDPDALKNWSVESNLEIAATQRELIDSAFHALRPGGTLVYSTCTLNRDENEDVCLWLKAQYPDAVDPAAGWPVCFGKRGRYPEVVPHVFPQIYDCEGFGRHDCVNLAVPPLPAPGFKVGNSLHAVKRP